MGKGTVCPLGRLGDTGMNVVQLSELQQVTGKGLAEANPRSVENPEDNRKPSPQDIDT